jgi:hypothetical protein
MPLLIAHDATSNRVLDKQFPYCSMHSLSLRFESGKMTDAKSVFRRPRDSPLFRALAFLAEGTVAQEIADQTSLGSKINNEPDLFASVNSSLA